MIENCNRCGKCCTWSYRDSIIRCQYLDGEMGNTTCRIYNNPERIGMIIDTFPCNMVCLETIDCLNGCK